MSWFLAKEKADKVITRCSEALGKSPVELNQVQKLMGSINDVAQMRPLMRAHKWLGNHFMKKFKGKENISLMIPELFKQDLVTIMKRVESSRTGLPIAACPASMSSEAYIVGGEILHQCRRSYFLSSKWENSLPRQLRKRSGLCWRRG